MDQRLVQRKQSTYEKAKVIATAKNIHKSTVGDIWLVESESKKGKFYAVQELESEMLCDCPSFVYGLRNPCKHILSLTIKEVAA